jgi:hypothetical protein
MRDCWDLRRLARTALPLGVQRGFFSFQIGNRLFDPVHCQLVKY